MKRRREEKEEHQRWRSTSIHQSAMWLLRIFAVAAIASNAHFGECHLQLRRNDSPSVDSTPPSVSNVTSSSISSPSPSPSSTFDSTLVSIKSVFDGVSDAIALARGDAGGDATRLSRLEDELLGYVDEALAMRDRFALFDGVQVEPVESSNIANETNETRKSTFVKRASGDEGFEAAVAERLGRYARGHALSVNVPRAARFFGFKSSVVPWKSSHEAFTEKDTMEIHRLFKKSLHYIRSWALGPLVPDGNTSSFFTGFGLGFLAFGLKKLLLPLFLGAQVVKSILIAMFLPSILGSLGKIVGKGLSQFSGSSINLPGHGGGDVGQTYEGSDDEQYKDQMGYATDDEGSYTYPLGTLPANQLYAQMAANEVEAGDAMSRYGPGGAKVTYLPSMSDNHYKNGHKKRDDFKVFKQIPPSSILLSNYDPFYSPLLSRLDSVFQRLGLGSEGMERCRERLVCFMYATPAKYAPYSNLISAQLSRELNELRKPTSDNPEILRFFRYMKAAKEGQEGVDCPRSYPQCPGVSAEGGSAAMITTYNDINKLVSARKLF